MFTILQIKAAHSKVKSGADFPKYILEIKELGINSYEHYVSNGHINYFGVNNFVISADTKYAQCPVTEKASPSKLKYFLKNHQRGKTDYSTFCFHAAEAGVAKWIVDLKKMTCAYYDKSGNIMLVEEIPVL